MCGLLYIKNEDGSSVNKLIKKAYLNQRVRGVKGFGLLARVIDPEMDGKPQFHYNIVHEVTERRILKYLKNHQSSEIMFHHRQPTSTGNVKNACHPFSTKNHFGNKEFILIHNGIISNDFELAQAHYEGGIDYSSVQNAGGFNDSEALLWDVSLTLMGLQEKPKAVGSCAFICLEKDLSDPSKNKLHYYRNAGNPLFMHRNDKVMKILSQIAPGQKADLVPADTLFTYNYENDSILSSAFKVGLDYSARPALPAGNKSWYTPTTSEEINKDFQAKVAKMLEPDFKKTENVTSEDIKALDEDEVAAVENQEEIDWQMERLNDHIQLKKDYETVAKEFLDCTNGFMAPAIYMIHDEARRVSLLPYDRSNWYRVQTLFGGAASIIADPFQNALDARSVRQDYVVREEDKSQTELPLDSVEAIFQGDHVEIKGKPTKIIVKTPDILDTVAENYETDPNYESGPVSVGTIISDELDKQNSWLHKHFNKKFAVPAGEGLVTHIPVKEG